MRHQLLIRRWGSRVAMTVSLAAAGGALAQPPDPQPPAPPPPDTPPAPLPDQAPAHAPEPEKPVPQEQVSPDEPLPEGEVIVVTGSRIGDPLGKLAPVLMLSREDL